MRAVSWKSDLACTHQMDDTRAPDSGSGFGLAMLICGETRVFGPAEVERILQEAVRAPAARVVLLPEPQTYESIEREAKAGSSWCTTRSGLLLDAPHLALIENHWDAERPLATSGVSSSMPRRARSAGTP
jgi:hypothetical protein